MDSNACDGSCLMQAESLYETALAQAKPHLGSKDRDISKRFKILKDIAGNDCHKLSEVLLEHALALFENAFGREHPGVGQTLLELSSLYKMHGNASAAEYTTTWAQEILENKRPAPEDSFFNLVGINEQGLVNEQVPSGIAEDQR